MRGSYVHSPRLEPDMLAYTLHTYVSSGTQCMAVKHSDLAEWFQTYVLHTAISPSDTSIDSLVVELKLPIHREGLASGTGSI